MHVFLCNRDIQLRGLVYISNLFTDSKLASRIPGQQKELPIWATLCSVCGYGTRLLLLHRLRQAFDRLLHLFLHEFINCKIIARLPRLNTFQGELQCHSPVILI